MTATVIVVALLLLAVYLALRSVIKNKGCSCGGCCGDCSACARRQGRK